VNGLEWHRYIRDECHASPEVRHFLHVLATYADGEGRCFPSLDTLARNLGIRRAAAKHRRDLAVAEGYLEVELKGRWRSAPTHYRLVRKGSVQQAHSGAERGRLSAKKGVGSVKKGVGGATPNVSRTFQ
jgi:hypothetical protein